MKRSINFAKITGLVLAALFAVAAIVFLAVFGAGAAATAHADDHVHEFTYSVGDLNGYDCLYATCTAEGCTLTTTGARLTGHNRTYSGSPVAAPVQWIYNADFLSKTGIDVTLFPFIFTGTANSGATYGPSETIPTDAGNYTGTVTVQINGVDYVLKQDFKINKKSASLITTPSSDGIIYDGTEQPIFNAPVADCQAVITYWYLSGSNVPITDGYTESTIWTATDCTPYKVQCKITPVGEDAYNYDMYSTFAYNVGIKQRSYDVYNNNASGENSRNMLYYLDGVQTTVTVPNVPGISTWDWRIPSNSPTYDGQEHTFEIKIQGVNDDVITLLSLTKSNADNLRDLSVYYVKNASHAADGCAAENYFANIKENTRFGLYIAKADYDMSGVVYTTEKEYNGKMQKLEVTGLPVGLDDIALTATATGSGATYPSSGEKNYTVTFATASANYNVPASVEKTFRIVKRNVTVTVGSVGCYDGEEKLPTVSFVVGENTKTATVAPASGADNVNAGAFEVEFTLGQEHDEDVYTLVAGEGYTVSEGVGHAAVTIAPRPVTVEVSGTSVYGSAIQEPVTNVISGSVIDGDIPWVSTDAYLSLSSTTKVADGSVTILERWETNYDVTFVGNVYSITPKPITVTADDAMSVYGDQLSSVLNATLPEGTLVGGDAPEDVFTLAKEAGIAAGEYEITVTGVNNPNYDLTGVSGVYTIAPRPITVIAQDHYKPYGDPNIYTLLADVIGSLAYSDTDDDIYSVSIDNLMFVDVGYYPIYVNLKNNPNYDVTAVNGTYTVNTRKVSVSGIAAKDKTYDGTTAAELDLKDMQISNAIMPDQITLIESITGEFNHKHTGPGMVTLTITLANSNYELDLTHTQEYANATINMKEIVVSGIAVADKYYDATTVATFDYTNAILAGKVEGDDLSVEANGSFEDINASEEAQTIHFVNLNLTGADATNYCLATDGQQTQATARICKKPIVISGISQGSTAGHYVKKEYDGTTVIGDYYFNKQNVVFGGIVEGQTLTVEVAGELEDKYPGENKTATISLTLGGEEDVLKNYVLAEEGQQTTVTGLIVQKKGITPTPGYVKEEGKYREYSEATVFTFAGTDFSAWGWLGGQAPIAGDDVYVESVSVELTNNNAGTKYFNSNYLTITLGGADAAYYTAGKRPDIWSSTSFVITRKTLTIQGVTVEDKEYDGYVDAEVDYSHPTLVGVVGSDAVSLVKGSTYGFFADKNAGENKTVTVTGFSLEGAQAGNYTLAPCELTATIHPYGIAVNGITASSKIYDGTTSATVDISGVSFTVLPGDDLTLVASGAFADKNVGVDKTVNLTLSFIGADKDNYAVNNSSQKTATASITAKELTVVWDLPQAGYVYTGADQIAAAQVATAETGVDNEQLLLVVTADKEFKNAGDYILTATQVMVNDNYALSGSMTQNVTIQKATATGITFEDKTVTYNAEEHTVTINGVLPEEVTVEYLNNALTVAGSVTATAKFTVSGNYNAIDDMTAVLTVNKATFEDIVFEDAVFTYDGAVKSLAIANVLNGEISVAYDNNDKTAAGEYTVTAVFTVSGNYNAIADVTATLTIKKAAYDLSGVTFDGFTVIYDGAAHTAEIEGALPTGVTVSYANNTLTNAGSVTATASFAGDSANYELIPNMTAVITVNKATFEAIVFEDGVFTYDGAVKSLAIANVLNEEISVAYDNNDKTAAGEYTVTAVFTVSGNYNAIADVTATLTIKKAAYDLTGVLFEDATYTYNGQERRVGISGKQLPGNVRVTYQNNTRTNAGSQTATASFEVINNAENYELIPDKTATLTINKATYNMSGVNFANQTKIYNGQTQYPDYTGTLPTGADGVQVTVSFDRGVTSVSQNNVYITVSFTGSDNYNTIASRGVYLTIAPKPLTVVWSNTERVYNGQKQTPTAVIDASEVCDGDDVHVEFDYLASKNVGNYTATARIWNFNEPNPNYVPTTGTATCDFTIVKRVVEYYVTLDGATVESESNVRATYGVNYATSEYINGVTAHGTHTVAAVVTNSVGEGARLDVSGSCVATNAGVYNMTFVLAGGACANYQFADGANTHELTWYVDALPVSVTLVGNTVVYGEPANYDYSTTLDGVWNTLALDSDNVFEVACEASSIMVGGGLPAVGNYPITVEDKHNANFTLTVTNEASVVVAPASLSYVSVAQNGALIYNRAEQTAEVTTTTSTTTGNNAISYAYSTEQEGEYAAAVPAFTAAGNYTVYFKASAANHAEASGSFSVVIGKATFGAIIFEDGVFTYDGVEKNIYIGTHLNDEITVAYLNNNQIAAGEYTVTAKFTVSDNYNPIADVTATLTINKAVYDLSGVRFENVQTVYDAAEHVALIEGSLPTGVTVSYANNTLINAGSATAKASFAGDSANYELIPDMTAVITVEKATFEAIVFADEVFTYSGSAYYLYVANGIPDEITVEYGNNGKTAAGVYVVTASFAVSDNYNPIADVTATLTINKAVYDMSGVAFDDVVAVYDGAAKTATVSGALPANVTVSYANNTITNVGSVIATASFTGDSANYELIPDMTAVITVNKATFGDITFEDAAFTYDGAAKSIAIATALNDEITVAYENNGKTVAGSYVVTAKFTVSDNYNAIADVTATLTINKAVYDLSGVTFANVTALYDGKEHVAVIAGTLPDGVTVAYENNALTDAGSVTAKAVFTGDAVNYEAIPDMTAIITVNEAEAQQNEEGVKIFGKEVSSEDAASETGVNVTELFKKAHREGTDGKAEVAITVKSGEKTSTIVFDAAAIAQLATASDIALSMSVVEDAAAITDEALAGAKLVIEVSLGGVSFTDGTATLSVPFEEEAPKGKVGKVYYVDQDGKRTDMKAKFEAGKVSFATSHFSSYIVVFEDQKSGLSGGAIAGIVIGCVFGAAAIAFGVWFLLKKKGILGKKAANE